MFHNAKFKVGNSHSPADANGGGDDGDSDDVGQPCVATDDPPNLVGSIPRKMTPPHGYLSTHSSTQMILFFCFSLHYHTTSIPHNLTSECG